MNKTLKYALGAVLTAGVITPALAQDNFPDVSLRVLNRINDGFRPSFRLYVSSHIGNGFVRVVEYRRNFARLAGKTALVWSEQGIGDEIMFANPINDALAEARHLVLECNARLVPIFRRSFPSASVVARRDPPDPADRAPAPGGVRVRAGP